MAMDVVHSREDIGTPINEFLRGTHKALNGFDWTVAKF